MFLVSICPRSISSPQVQLGLPLCPAPSRRECCLCCRQLCTEFQEARGLLQPQCRNVSVDKLLRDLLTRISTPPLLALKSTPRLSDARPSKASDSCGFPVHRAASRVACSFASLFCSSVCRSSSAKRNSYESHVGESPFGCTHSGCCARRATWISR